MAVRVLDALIKIGFAGILAGLLIPDVGGSPSVSLVVILAGFVLIAAAGFWRARTVRLERQSRSTPLVIAPGVPPVESGGASRRQNRLRDVGLICFPLGLFLLLVSFAILFIAPPQPRLVAAGGVLTMIGAGALAIRYRFFALLLVCFLVSIALIAGLVAWPPTIGVLLALLIVGLLARSWRRQPRPRSR